MKLVVGILAVASAAHADPLTVEVKPATLAWHVHKPVDVAVRVVNTSSTKQSIQVWSCSWEMNWTSADPVLTWDGTPCTKNGVMNVELAPGKAYEKSLAMHATMIGNHPLRLGFTPEGGTLTWGPVLTIVVER